MTACCGHQVLSHEANFTCIKGGRLSGIPRTIDLAIVIVGRVQGVSCFA